MPARSDLERSGSTSRQRSKWRTGTRHPLERTNRSTDEKLWMLLIRILSTVIRMAPRRTPLITMPVLLDPARFLTVQSRPSHPLCHIRAIANSIPTSTAFGRRRAPALWRASSSSVWRSRRPDVTRQEHISAGLAAHDKEMAAEYDRALAPEWEGASSGRLSSVTDRNWHETTGDGGHDSCPPPGTAGCIESGDRVGRNIRASRLIRSHT